MPMPRRSGTCIRAKIRATSGGVDERVSLLTTTITTNARGTETAAG